MHCLIVSSYLFYCISAMHKYNKYTLLTESALEIRLILRLTMNFVSWLLQYYP